MFGLTTYTNSSVKIGYHNFAPFNLLDAGFNSFSKRLHNLKDLEDRYELNLNCAGYKKNEIKVELFNSVLSVYSEIKGKEFSREIQLSFIDDIDNEKVSAKLEDGLLLITLPKKINKTNKKIIDIK